jgi:isopentenyl diphosphate isomerase/L-lactate dehydrogenase-like FMN-dependent dehydrogenase
MKMKPTEKFDRSKQRATILVENPKFQEEVMEIRKKFNIPLIGIKTNEESGKWHHEFYESDTIYFSANREKVRVEIERLEKEKKFQEGFNLHRKFNQEAPVNALNLAIKRMLENFRLPFTWHHSIQRYILFNNIDSMWLPGNISIREDYDQETDLRRLSIEIDDTTTLEDIKYAWPRIKLHQKRLQSYTKKKIQPIKNFERDREAYNLRQSGKSYNGIADILSKKFDKVVTSEDVASYIKRYKKLVGIN